jgi:AcrR family transcriptional regulator
MYDHFASKRELFIALLGEQADALLGDVARGIAGAGPPEGRMRDTIDAFLLAVGERPFAARVLLSPVPGDAAVLDAQREIAERVNAALRELLGADLRRAGLQPASDRATAAVELIVSGLVGVARWWLEHRDLPREQLTAVAMGVLWDGLNAAAER